MRRKKRVAIITDSIELDRINRIYFSVLIRAIDRDDYMRKLEQLSNMSDKERTIT